MKLSIILAIVATISAEICVESSITLSVNKNYDLQIAIIGSPAFGYVFLDNKIVLDALYSNNYRTVIVAGVHNIAHNVTSSAKVCVNYAERRDPISAAIIVIDVVCIIVLSFLLFCMIGGCIFHILAPKCCPNLAKRLDES